MIKEYDIAHNKETVYEAMIKFVNIYNTHAKKKGDKKFVIIHGYGSSGSGGRIQKALYEYLKQYSGICTMQPINAGSTQITAGRPIPDYISIIDDFIMEICTEPKPFTKIVGLVFKRYRSFSEKGIQQRLNLFIKQGKLKIVVKGNYKCYIIR